jgi:hypothetical protein
MAPSPHGASSQTPSHASQSHKITLKTVNKEVKFNMEDQIETNSAPARVGNPNWVKGGASPNPKGRGKAVRDRLGGDIVDSVSKLWAEGGEAVMRRLMVEQPDVFAKLAVQIGVPKESLARLEVSQAAPVGGLSPDEWATMRDLLGVIERSAPGAARERVFEALDGYLRSELAAPLPMVEIVESVPVAIEPEALPQFVPPPPLPR